jgi:hypothetical protein
MFHIATGHTGLTNALYGRMRSLRDILLCLPNNERIQLNCADIKELSARNI